MDKLIYRIEHADNITTGICESCENYEIISLERFNGEYVYVCSNCEKTLEEEMFYQRMRK